MIRKKLREAFHNSIENAAEFPGVRAEDAVQKVLHSSFLHFFVSPPYFLMY